MRRPSRQKLQALLYLLLAAALFLVLMPPPNAEKTAPKKVLFYGKGVVSYTLPQFGPQNYGAMAAGMYGAFVEIVRLFGFESSVTKEIPESLDDIDLMVFTNLDHSLPDETQKRIWNYVEQGGKLWVLGDHTFIKNGTNHVNGLLSPNRIRFENDSAKHFVQGWFESYELRWTAPFATTMKNDAENSFGMLVGASLRIQPPATPILLGTYGYGDIGAETDIEKRGHLGDFKYSRDERLGDMVLIAGQPYGKGKIVVFGDTTSFFNGNTTSTYELIRVVLTYLNLHTPWNSSASWFIRILPFLLLAGLLTLSFRRKPWPQVPIMLGMLMVYALFWQHQAGLIPYDFEKARTKLALVDYSRNPKVSKHGSMPDALSGLQINLLRYGLLPVTPDSWDRSLLQNSRVLFLNAPLRPYSDSHIQDLRNFMANGGTIIMTCGRKEAAGSRTFLEEMGLEIMNIPLGRFFDREALGAPVSFFSVWPIRITGQDVEVMTTYENGWPLIVRKKWARGSLVLIGDSSFFHNKNFEGDGNHDINNINFFRRLMDHVTKDAAAQ